MTGPYVSVSWKYFGLSSSKAFWSLHEENSAPNLQWRMALWKNDLSNEKYLTCRGISVPDLLCATSQVYLACPQGGPLWKDFDNYVVLQVVVEVFLQGFLRSGLWYVLRRWVWAWAVWLFFLLPSNRSWQKMGLMLFIRLCDSHAIRLVVLVIDLFFEKTASMVWEIKNLLQSMLILLWHVYTNCSISWLSRATSIPMLFCGIPVLKPSSNRGLDWSYQVQR